MNKENIKSKRLAIISGLVILMFLTYFNFPHPMLKTDEQGFSHVVWDGNIVLATENSTIGAAASGFLEVFFVNHSNDPANAYNTNDSSLFELWGNASTDPDGNGLTWHSYANYGGFNLTVKWGVAMDMVVRYRGNRTVCYAGGIFHNESCRIKVNATGGGCTALASTVFSNIQSENQTDETFLWINAYYSIGTLSKGGTYTITNIKVEFNY